MSGYYTGNPLYPQYWHRIINHTDAAYMHGDLGDSNAYIYPETYTEPTSSSYSVENFNEPTSGFYVAAGCGRIVTNGKIYNIAGDTISSSIVSGNVAVGGNRIVAIDSSNQTGYIYDLDGNQLATFTPFTGGYWGSSYTINETNQNFGASVSVGCGRIVVGATLWDGPWSASDLAQSTYNNGTVYIYDLDGNPIKKIESPFLKTAIGTSPAGYDSEDSNFGCSVSVGNGRIVVGASTHDGQVGASVTDPGKAFVYTLHGALLYEIVSSGIGGGDEFGYSVAIGCGKIVVGSPNEGVSGRTRVYQRNGDFITKLRGLHLSSGARFGESVAIKNDVIAVGADEDDFWDKGIVLVYNLRYRLIERLIKSGGLSTYEGFGKKVAIGSNRIVVSHAPGNTIFCYRINPSSNSYWEDIADGYFQY